MHLNNTRGLILCSPHPYLRFSYSFRPRGESATFLFATMVLTHVKSALKTRSEMFVRPSKIFVWGSYFSTISILNISTKVLTVILSKCSKWRLSKNRGLVADGCLKSTTFLSCDLDRHIIMISPSCDFACGHESHDSQMRTAHKHIFCAKSVYHAPRTKML